VRRCGDTAGSFSSARRIPQQFKVSAEADRLLCEFPALNINCRPASNKDSTSLTKQKLRYISVHTTDSELERFTLESELRSNIHHPGGSHFETDSESYLPNSDEGDYILMLYGPCIVVYQYSKTNEMRFLYSIYYELIASTCFEHYLLIFRRRCTNNDWYTECVLPVSCYQVWSGTGDQFHSNPGSSQPT
jgi:hypothetical protein